MPKEYPSADAKKNQEFIENAARRIIRNTKIKCTITGAATSFGGFAAMPITLPANVTSVMYFQIRMVVALAIIGGYDVKSDETRTIILAVWSGISLANILKHKIVFVSTQITKNLISKIPYKLYGPINKAIGFKLIVKSGKAGVVNMGKAIPLVGAAVGGSLDYGSTSLVAKRAYNAFIKCDFSDGDPIDLEDTETGTVKPCDNAESDEINEGEIIE